MPIKIDNRGLGDRFLGNVKDKIGSVLSQLATIGDLAVEEAVTNGSYHDVTGNLRSSIGYVVSYGGRVVKEGGFERVLQATEGPARGRALAQSKASEVHSGAALILVAGMKYAQLVADRGNNVLDSAELLVERLIRELK